MPSVAYFGEPGSFSEQAAMAYFGSRCRFLPFKFLPDVFDSVEGSADYGVVPIENSIEGAVTQTYDMLLEHRLSVVGEKIIRISHSLLALRGVRLKDVRQVYSHPQALGQCRKYLERLRVEAVPFYDTAGSARMIREKERHDAAAIASERAARIYGLAVLANGIEANKRNYTRFFIVSRRRARGRGDRTSIVFSTGNRPGALFSALTCFALNKVNLAYLQSRPILGKPWEYHFYADLEGDERDTGVRKALLMLEEESEYVKVLGSYNRAKRQ